MVNQTDPRRRHTQRVGLVFRKAGYVLLPELLRPHQEGGTDRSESPLAWATRGPTHQPLQAIKHNGLTFSQGQPVAFGGAELGLGGEGLLAGEGGEARGV